MKMKAPSKKEWLKVYYFIMFLGTWVAYALRAWAMPEHVAVYVAALVILGLAAAGARVVAARSGSEAESGDASLKQRELAALAEEMLERARRRAP
jgi:hypothetical protein